MTKSNAFRVDTFDSRDFGVLGYVDSDARVLFYRAVTRPHTTATPFDVRGRKDLPRVDIVYSYAGADGVLVDALISQPRERRPDGMVLVGFGGGSYPAAFFEAGKRAVQAGIPVVLATRSWNGRVVTTPRLEKQRLHRLRRPHAAESADSPHARAHRHARARGNPGDVLQVLT